MRGNRDAAGLGARRGVRRADHDQRTAAGLTLSATLIPRTGDSDFNHQAALALFGEFALKCDSLDDILTEGCRLVGEALGTHLAKVVELQPDGRAMLIRAGVGWQPGIVGQMLIDAAARTPERLALDSGEPVISPDIDREDRFEVPALVKENGVRAAILSASRSP